MARKFTNNSKREFLLIFIEQGHITKVTLTLEDLFMFSSELGGDFEYLYSIAEHTDEILDLKINENIFVYGNRDNKESKGVLTRLK